MEKNYDHKSFEEKCLKLWETCDKPKFDPETTEKYSLALPPPNRTSRLHAGHAFNGTMHDILARYHRMKGSDVSFLVGTDSAGISCQYMVTKTLLKEGINTSTMSRQELVNEIEKWVAKHGNIITDQLERIGLSCDWSKNRYTKDPQYDELVKESFVRIYNDGLIYKGKYLVNFCFKCGTTLSDDEVNDDKYDGKLYYIKYKIKDSDESITVATTRPETFFGDSAVACNPDDERYKKYVGMKCIVPIINKEIPIIFDKSIDMEFGTGLMKVTPAHCKADYEIGKQHNLEMCNILDKYGKLCDTGTSYDGAKLHLIKDKLVEELKLLGLIEKIDKYETLNKSCYKCANPVENILSDQWFISMKPLAEKAIEIVDQLNFFPEHNKAIYLHWLNKTTDWCISRQVCWAHDIPAWNCNDCNFINVSNDDIASCAKCGSTNLEKEKMVLDTWFASSLYAHGVFKTEEEYEKFFPLNVIISGSDIIFFWITRMIMMSLYFKKKIPFKDIYLHGLIRDEKNIKMSKTLGNVIDPLVIIEDVGADALRFGLMYNLVDGRDIKLQSNAFKNGRTFCTKLWNCVRYLLTMRTINSEIKTFDLTDNNELNTEFINRIKDVVKECEKNITEYDFSVYVKSLYSFVWNEFCNGYLEKVKDDQTDKTTELMLYTIIQIIKLLHPVIPFITEEIYQKLKSLLPELDLLKGDTIIYANFSN
jgi:valyl-tRNA synthetase